MYTFEQACTLQHGNIASRDLVMRGPDGEKVGGIVWDDVRYNGHLEGIKGWVASPDIEQVKRALLIRVAQAHVKRAA